MREQRGRLLRFIRRRIPDPAQAEDILQDVFAELVESYRVLRLVEQVAAWLFRVACNRITDLYRRKKSLAWKPRFRPPKPAPTARDCCWPTCCPSRRAPRKPPAARNPDFAQALRRAAPAQAV